MNSIFAKIALMFGLILGVAAGPNYIQIFGSDHLNFNFKTGDNFPIIYVLNVTNIGYERSRFDISSNVPWIFVYKENQPSAKSVEMSSGQNVNFVLEIRAEQAADGGNSAVVSVQAVNLSDFSVLERKDINIVLNKNIVVAVSPQATPAASPVNTATPSLPPETGTALPSPTVSKIASTTQTPKPVKTPAPQTIQKTTAPPSPAETSKPPVQTKPETAEQPSFIKSIFNFFKRLFF